MHKIIWCLLIKRSFHFFATIFCSFSQYFVISHLPGRKTFKIPSSQLSISSFWKIFHSFLKTSTGSGRSCYIQWIISLQIFSSIPVWELQSTCQSLCLTFLQVLYDWLLPASFSSLIIKPHRILVLGSLCYSKRHFSTFWLRDMAKYCTSELSLVIV